MQGCILVVGDRTNEMSEATSRYRWRVAPRWRAQFHQRSLPVESWIASPHARIVKEGEHRTVYRLDLPEGCFFLKRYRSGSFARQLLARVRGTASHREWRQTLRIRARGIPTIEPIAFGEAGGPRDNYFLSAEVSGAIPLSDYLAREWPRTTSSTRRQLCRALADLIARAHDAGVCHDDLHPGNILIHTSPDSTPLRDTKSTCACEPALVLIDLTSVRVGRSLSWRQTRDNLVMLRASFERLVPRSEFLRFWKHYWRLRSRLSAPRGHAARADIESRAQCYLRHLYLSRDKRFFRKNRDFYSARSSPRTAFAVSEVDPRTVAQIAANPGQLLVEHLHRPIKLTRGTILVETSLTLGDRSRAVAYKQYRSRNAWKTLLDLLRGSRARRAWRAGHALLSRGIATPRPLLMCEASHRPSGISHLATTWLADARNLHEYAWHLGSQPVRQRTKRVRQVARSLGALVGRLHHWHFTHRDLKGCNLLIIEQPEAVEAFLVDLDSVRRTSWVRRPRAIKNVARLAASMSGYGWVSRTDRLRFLLGYLQEARIPRREWKAYWRAVDQDEQLLIERMRRRGKPIL